MYPPTIMGVSKNGGTPKNTPKWSFLVKKTIVVVYHHFRKPPYESITRPSPYLYPRRSEESALLEDRQSLHDLHQAKAANMGVSKNRDTPKWMVKIMENLIKMDDLGGTKTYFRKQPHGCIGSIVEFGWV